jgi:hypothetical protein
MTNIALLRFEVSSHLTAKGRKGKSEVESGDEICTTRERRSRFLKSGWSLADEGKNR